MDFGAFQDEICAIIHATWPEINLPSGSPRNLITSVQATQEQLVEALKDGRYTTPLCFLQFGSFSTDNEFGSNHIQRAPVTIWYFSNYGQTDEVDWSQVAQPELDARLRLLREIIDDPAGYFQTFQVIERAAINTNESNAINAALMDVSKIPILAGCLMWQPGFIVDA